MLKVKSRDDEGSHYRPPSRTVDQMARGCFRPSTGTERGKDDEEERDYTNSPQEGNNREREDGCVGTERRGGGGGGEEYVEMKKQI